MSIRVSFKCILLWYEDCMGNSEKEMIITILPTIQGCSSYFVRVCVNSTTDVKILIRRASIVVLPLVWCQIFGC